MNPLRPPSSSSRKVRAGQVKSGQGRAGQGTAGQGRGAPAAAAPFGLVAGAAAAPTDGSSQATSQPAVVAAASSSPTLASLQAAGFPAWWASSSPLGSSEGMYPPDGFTNFLHSDQYPNHLNENFHFVGSTKRKSATSPVAPSSEQTPPAETNAQDKETINVDADGNNYEDERTERRLNWTKDEDVRLAATDWPYLQQIKQVLDYKLDVQNLVSTNPTPTDAEPHDEDGSIEPENLYTLEEFEAEQEVLEDLQDAMFAELKNDIEALEEGRRRNSGPRRYVARPREEAHERLMEDYFTENPVYNSTIFRRRFRMRRPLFLRIVDALGEWSPFFTLRYDALNRPGLSPIQKCTAAIRQLAYGSPADQLDEYIKIGESTAVECLKLFVEGVIAVFGAEYLRRPTVQDVERLMEIGERRGFPGMLGSIDCMHWHWEKCPYGWNGMYTRGDHGVPTIILEAVASHDRWIWHAFFGVAGSNNDINVLSQSDLSVKHLRGEDPKLQYSINGREYNIGYYLADGIYPEWPVFVKSIKKPQVDEHKLFAEKQEGARKDVECAFGILQSRFCILRRPARLYEQGDLQNIMLACIILHNMIIEDEKDIEQVPFDLNEEGSTYIVEEATITHGENPEMEDVINRNAALHDRLAYKQLQSDLIEHIWQKFGNSYRQNN